MKLALVFPGQGSQSVGMLQGYAGVPGVQEVVDEARRILGAEFTTLLDQGPAEQLDLTINTQPAMLTAGYAAYQAWRGLGGPEPAVVAGHSLGEYTALVVAGALEFADALPLVRLRAQAMQEAVPAGEGAMAAILSLDEEKVRQACSEAGGLVQAVNFNSPEQIVIAGEKAAVQRASERCTALGAKRVVPLPVSAPFHSSLMKPAGDKLRHALAKVAVSAPKVSLINNVDVKSEASPEAIKDALVRQASSPVRWIEAIRAMRAQGVTHVLECGPGKALAGMVKRIDRELLTASLNDRASIEKALKA
jgi:[acyl-carrier-protein] S-malonyltransferase